MVSKIVTKIGKYVAKKAANETLKNVLIPMIIYLIEFQWERDRLMSVKMEK